ncbi:LuxR family transcriptional regulator [Allorhizobium sp. BGMRC 0089]|uniref:helix-turn-helix transcriptional regulator n=1 Tax=Allorhizobium sonneratiae TaxID=2934936 RepID=UPI0020337DC1|nr:LuxR family transcriptional regulator [Allorhizobium sonneratiae]MCM2292385.1 LuxR family transcriptional regulator [Allorhizobium sonneratiae]
MSDFPHIESHHFPTSSSHTYPTPLKIVSKPNEKKADLQNTIEDIRDSLNVEHAFYLKVENRNIDRSQKVIYTTCPEAWNEKYLRQDNLKNNLIQADIHQSILPIDWTNINGPGTRDRQIFTDAVELGVGNCGLIFRMSGYNGEFAIMSVSTYDDHESWKMKSQLFMPHFIYAAMLFHNKVIDASRDTGSKNKKMLSRREKEVLIWASKGKTAWETAKILGLSVKTVYFYLSNINEKLQVSNKIHAVAKAIELGYLL